MLSVWGPWQAAGMMQTPPAIPGMKPTRAQIREFAINPAFSMTVRSPPNPNPNPTATPLNPTSGQPCV
jgi:hypothetical protein